MSTETGIGFQMARRDPAGWAKFIDGLYHTGIGGDSAREIVERAFMAAIDAGYRAAVNAAAAEIDLRAANYEFPSWQKRPLTEDEVKELLSHIARAIENIRPPKTEPAPGEEGKG